MCVCVCVCVCVCSFIYIYIYIYIYSPRGNFTYTHQFGRSLAVFLNLMPVLCQYKTYKTLFSEQ